MKTFEQVTTAAVAMPPSNYPKTGASWRLFDVSSDVFRRFQTGRNRFERWSKYLNIEEEDEAAIYRYATSYPSNTVVLRCKESGALRAIRRRSSNGV